MLNQTIVCKAVLPFALLASLRILDDILLLATTFSCRICTSLRMSTAEQQALKFLTNQQDPELATLIHSQPLPAIAARITLDKLAQARMPLSYVAMMQTLVSQQSEGAPEESSALALHCLVSKLTEMDSCFVCDVVLAMHAAGVSLNQPNTEMDTPLHLAARSGHLQLCQLLLQQGADPLARNSKNR